MAITHNQQTTWQQSIEKDLQSLTKLLITINTLRSILANVVNLSSDALLTTLSVLNNLSVISNNTRNSYAQNPYINTIGAVTLFSTLFMIAHQHNKEPEKKEPALTFSQASKYSVKQSNITPTLYPYKNTKHYCR